MSEHTLKQSKMNTHEVLDDNPSMLTWLRLSSFKEIGLLLYRCRMDSTCIDHLTEYSAERFSVTWQFDSYLSHSDCCVAVPLQLSLITGILLSYDTNIINKSKKIKVTRNSVSQLLFGWCKSCASFHTFTCEWCKPKRRAQQINSENIQCVSVDIHLSCFRSRDRRGDAVNLQIRECRGNEIYATASQHIKI